MNIIYPAICHKEADGSFWGEFPDLDGCFSQAASEPELITNLRESLEGYSLTILEEGKKLPKPSLISEIKTEQNDFTTYIECAISTNTKYVRKNVTLPEWLSKKASKSGLNLSHVFQEALYNILYK